MTAEQLLTSDIPLLRPIDNVKCALDMMDEYKLAQLTLDSKHARKRYDK